MAVAAAFEQTGEQLRSFDPLASVRMMQYDLSTFGQVLPETRERVMDEEASYLVEGIDRAARTSFVLARSGDELVYFDQGNWRPYMAMLYTGLETAEHEAAADPRLSFMAERATADLRYGYAMQELAPGQTVSWYSPYPKQEADRYGVDFIRDRGFAPHREMGFLYRAHCQSDGSIVLESQTVDRSNEAAFSAAMQTATFDPDSGMDGMVAAYDAELSGQWGGDFFAGRKEAEIGENAWLSLMEHRDLLAFLLDGLEEAAASELSEEQLEVVVKRHVYGVWAAFKKRLDGVADTGGQQFASNPAMPTAIQMEVMRAHREFAAQGQILIGCGGAIQMLQGEQAIMAASGEDVFGSIFGSKNKAESYSFSKFMFCVSCQAPPKENESKKMCGPCGLCRSCDKKYGGNG